MTPPRILTRSGFRKGCGVFWVAPEVPLASRTFRMRDLRGCHPTRQRSNMTRTNMDSRNQPPGLVLLFVEAVGGVSRGGGSGAGGIKALSSQRYVDDGAQNSGTARRPASTPVGAYSRPAPKGLPETCPANPTPRWRWSFFPPVAQEHQQST